VQASHASSANLAVCGAYHASKVSAEGPYRAAGAAALLARASQAQQLRAAASAALPHKKVKIISSGSASAEGLARVTEVPSETGAFVLGAVCESALARLFASLCPSLTSSEARRDWPTWLVGFTVPEGAKLVSSPQSTLSGGDSDIAGSFAAASANDVAKPRVVAACWSAHGTSCFVGEGVGKRVAAKVAPSAGEGIVEFAAESQDE